MRHDDVFPEVATGVSEETAVSFLRKIFHLSVKGCSSIFFRSIDAYLSDYMAQLLIMLTCEISIIESGKMNWQRGLYIRIIYYRGLALVFISYLLFEGAVFCTGHSALILLGSCTIFM
jgi:hypothetical protein